MLQTFVSTAFHRAKWWRLPESSASDCIRKTQELQALNALTAAAMVSSISTVQGPRRRRTQVTRCGDQEWTFWRWKSFLMWNWLTGMDFLIYLLHCGVLPIFTWYARQVLSSNWDNTVPSSLNIKIPNVHPLIPWVRPIFQHLMRKMRAKFGNWTLYGLGNLELV